MPTYGYQHPVVLISWQCCPASWHLLNSVVVVFVWLYMRRHGSVCVRSAQSGSACAHQAFCHQPQKKALSTKDKKRSL